MTRMDIKFNHQMKLELSPTAVALDILAIDILGSLPRTEAGSRFVVVMTVKYTKLIREIPIARVTSTKVA